MRGREAQGLRRPVVAALLALLVGGCPRSADRERGRPPPLEASSASHVAGGTLDARASLPAPALAPAFRERASDRARLVADIRAQGVHDKRVLAALRKVPRHAFVPAAYAGEAYDDMPLPIGHGQTISQPFIVAFMTEAVAPQPTDRCLEIGTGSGYQAAILAELCARTYSIEYLPAVARFGQHNLRALGYGPGRVALRVGDGYLGWPEAAPFDAIIVTAAPEHVPQPLLDQLAVGGRLVIPVGTNSGIQWLETWTRRRAGGGPGAFDHHRSLPVRFVPFLGERGSAP